MRTELGPSRNKGHGAGWMLVDSGQMRAAMYFWGKYGWEMKMKEMWRDVGVWSGFLIRNFRRRRLC